MVVYVVVYVKKAREKGQIDNYNRYLATKIFILFHDFTFEYDENTHVKIDLIRKTITTINEFDIDKKLKKIQTKLQIKNGSLDHELPEQKMAVRNLTGKEKVLEIGGT